MTDRAQLGRPRWLPVALTCAAVLAVVIAEVWEEVGAVEGPIEYCGLCHVDWRPVAGLLIIGTLVTMLIALAWGVRGRFIPPR